MNKQKTKTSFSKSVRIALAATGMSIALATAPGILPPALAASKIAILVNNVPITTNDIKRRAAFVKLRRMKGNRTKIAREELVKEALQMQEAKRLRRVASDAQVEAAYKRFAQRNKMPLKALNQVMARSGVTVKGFKQFIRAQMSWQGAVQLRAGSAGRSTAPKSMHIRVLGASSSVTERTTQYAIKQVVFVVPRSKQKTQSSRRMAEANNFRSRFTGCDSAVRLASSLRDVTVRDIGRKQVHELPSRWKKEIESTTSGKTTRPLKTEKGVELLAICGKRQVLSKKQAGSGDSFDFAPSNDKEFAALEKKYMEELRKVATIKNR